MKALLLAAGLGSRLKPITNTIPKCLVPIGGRPLLDFWLSSLIKSGVDRVFINTFYHADAVKHYVSSSIYRDRVTLIEEDQLFGTGGTLRRNFKYFLDEPFLLAHADNICLTDLKGFIDYHLEEKARYSISMMTFRTLTPRTCGIVKLDQEDCVVDFFEKVDDPPSNNANGAVFIMNPEIAEFCSKIKKDVFEISIDIIPSFLGQIRAWENNDYHLDIGSPQTYRQAHGDLDKIEALAKRFAPRSDGDTFSQLHD